MTTTPLPRMPVCKHKDVQHQRRYIGDVYTKEQMQAYATQARADLEAENKRLMEALKEIADDYADRFDLDSPSTNPGIKYVIKQARAALENRA